MLNKQGTQGRTKKDDKNLGGSAEHQAGEGQGEAEHCGGAGAVQAPGKNVQITS